MHVYKTKNKWNDLPRKYVNVSVFLPFLANEEKKEKHCSCTISFVCIACKMYILKSDVKIFIYFLKLNEKKREKTEHFLKTIFALFLLKFVFSNQLVSAILNCVWLDVLHFVPPLFELLYLMSSTVSMLNSARLVFVHCFRTLWPFNQVDKVVSKNLIEIHNDSFVNQDLCRFQYAHCLTFYINWFVHCNYLKREKRTNVRNILRILCDALFI